MEPNERIQQLEKQVRELSDAIRQLAVEKDAKEERRPASQPQKQKPVRPKRSKEEMRRNVDRVLGGEQGETLETRIGGIWLSRIAMVLLMTLVVLGARVTLYTEIFGPAQKIAISFAASAIAVTYGSVWWRSKSIFPETVLGAGLAGLYFTVYAAFFVEGMQVLDQKILAAPLLAIGLAVLLAILHARRSQAAAGIAMFLVYYTVVASAMSGTNVENLVYALACSSAMAVAAMAFHVLHRWLLFSWAALIATYGTYFFYFTAKPPELHVTDVQYFWLSNGFLALCYVVFSVGCIFDARKTGEFRRTVGQMCGVNSAIFFCMTWFAIRDQYPDQEWLFRLAFSAMLLAFALLAQFAGPRNNYLFQIFIAKALVMFTLAMQAYLSGEKLMVAMALECLGLAFSYKRSGIVMFKVLGVMLLLVAFVGCLFQVPAAGATAIGGGIRIPSNWFCCAGSALVFLAVAWFYERFIRRVRPEHRIVPGQWFLADTALDLGSGTAALLYAAAAAFLLLIITIMDLGTNPQLPFILAGQGVMIGTLGFVSGAPQIEVAGILLLVACHVCYYVFLFIAFPLAPESAAMAGSGGFDAQAGFVPYTVLVALFTYVGAWFWERYLTRVKGGRPWEHHFVAALPYLVATLMLNTLLMRKMDAMDIVLAQEILGILLLIVGALSGYPGVKASGLLAFAVAVGIFCQQVFYQQTGLIHQPYFLPHFFLFLMALVMAERLFVVLQRQERRPSKLEDCIRVVLVAVSTILGAVVLRIYAKPDVLTSYWVGLAVSAVALGAFFRESRYRWAAIVLFGAAIVRAFQFDLRRLPPAYSFVSFAVLTAASLIVTWSYSRYRQRVLKKTNSDAQDETTRG